MTITCEACLATVMVHTMDRAVMAAEVVSFLAAHMNCRRIDVDSALPQTVLPG